MSEGIADASDSARLIVCHGWMADSTMFAPMRPSIDPDAFQVVFHDHAGYGSRQGEESKSLTAQAEEILELTAELGWTRFSVLGHSMGALVAQELALSAPASIASVVLLCPVLAAGRPLGQAQLRAKELCASDPRERERNAHLNAGNIATGEFIAARSLATAPPDAMTGVLPSWASPPDHTEALLKCPVRALFITGAEDPAVNGEQVAQAASAWFQGASQHVELPTGHYPMAEQPEILWESMKSFVQESLHRADESAGSLIG